MIDRSEQVYVDFLQELDALERFRERFQERNPAVPLSREDPDVRRLIEAMAFFSMQTRHATLKNLRSTWNRLFAGYFGFLLTPSPAATLVQAVPTDKMVEPVTLPRGSELRLSAEGTEPGVFRTQRDLRVLPIFQAGCDVLPLPAGGYRLIARFEARFPRRDPLEVLSLHVRHLDSYRTSLAVHHALRKSLRSVAVLYDALADEVAVGEPCEFAFGPSPPAPEDDTDFQHPIERMRSYLHFPERELYLHVQVAPARQPWTRFALLLDLDGDWTVGRTLHPDFLLPFTVPVVNLKKEAAQVVIADGTRSEFSILPMSPGRGTALHSVLGVYELTKTGMAPLRPAYLPGVGPSYELEENWDDKLEVRHSLVLDLPGAFEAPRKVAVEALWHQPGFVAGVHGRVDVTTPGRHIEGLKWKVATDLRPPRESAVRDDLSALVQLLSWKVKPVLTRDELVAVLGFVDIAQDNPLRRPLGLLRDLRCTVAPDGLMQGSGIRHVYDLTLSPFDAGNEPVVHAFLLQVRELLDIWNADASIELRPTVAGGGPFPLFAGRA